MHPVVYKDKVCAQTHPNLTAVGKSDGACGVVGSELEDIHQGCTRVVDHIAARDIQCQFRACDLTRMVEIDIVNALIKISLRLRTVPNTSVGNKDYSIVALNSSGQAEQIGVNVNTDTVADKLCVYLAVVIYRFVLCCLQDARVARLQK